MIRTLILNFVLLSSSLFYGQSFEGKLTYKVEYDIATKKIGAVEITKQQILEKMISDGEYFDSIFVSIKDGNYLKVDNSSEEKSVLYHADANKIYIFQKDMRYETDLDAKQYYALDLGFKQPKIEKIDTLKNINGIDCSLVKLSWDTLGAEYYFYNSQIVTLDPTLFKAHNFEYFNTIVGITHSYPIEIIKTVNNYISIKMTLVSISKEEVSDELFDIEKIRVQRSSNLQNQTTQWKLFRDDTVGYTVEYPENWIPQGGNGGFMCGSKKGLAHSEFMIWWSEIDNTERMDMLFNDDGFYDGYESVEKAITINGIEGVYYVWTHQEKPNEYHESIVLKTKTTWYQISNAGVKNNWFEYFYNSFKLIDKN